MPAPLWSRVLTQLSRNAYRAHRLQEIVRDELLFAYLPAQARNDVTINAYDSTPSYAADGYVLRRGLFVWEKALLEDPSIPKSGRVVLTAAGGGRELVALVGRGHEVVAFEPSPLLFRAAQQAAQGLKGASVRSASYYDLVAHAAGRPSELDGLDLSAELVWLGWGSFTHLTEPAEQLEVLRAVRRLWPAAPVVLSFFLRKRVEEDPKAPSIRLRYGLRSLFGKLGGHRPPPGLEFQTHEGFSYSFERGEVEALFEAAGYRPALLREDPFPHAVLVPR